MFYANKPFMMMASMTLITSSIMALSSSNWIFLWMSMEINMLSFIPMITNSKSNQETEAAIKYFMAQALGSSLMLMTSMSQWTTSSLNYMNMLLIAAIMLKLGMVPFHFWFPSVMTSLSWMSCLILATWQKLAPLIILSFILYNTANYFIMYVAAMNAILGGMMGMNQAHMRTIMAYSSITHMGWMTSLLYIMKPTLTMVYYILYCSVTIPLFMMLSYNSQQNNKQLNKMNSMSPIMQLMLPIMLLSLSGMPPFTGFIPKWLTIYSLCQEMPIMLMIMILGAMMNMYFYSNIMFNSLLSINFSQINSISNKMNMYAMPIIATMSLFLAPLIML